MSLPIEITLSITHSTMKQAKFDFYAHLDQLTHPIT